MAQVRDHVLPVIAAARPDPGLDHRRYGLPQEGAALGGRGSAVLRSARQAGQLPGRREPVGGERGRQPADRAPAVPAPGLGRRPRPAPPRRRAGRGGVPNQAADRPRPDPGGAGGRRAARTRAGRRRLRHRHRVPRRHHRTRPALRRRHPVLDQPVAARHRPLPPKPYGGRGRPPSLVGRDAEHAPSPPGNSPSPAQARLAPRHLARGHQRHARVALRRRPGPPGPSRLQAVRAAARGMVPDRVAGQRSRTHANTGCAPCLRPPHAEPWSTWPSCAGASSATTRTSSRNSASATTKGADGAASITTPPCASPPTGSSSPSAAHFPPQPDEETRRQAPALPAGYRPRGAPDPT